jgi:hypothetical protein
MLPKPPVDAASTPIRLNPFHPSPLNSRSAPFINQETNKSTIPLLIQTINQPILIVRIPPPRTRPPTRRPALVGADAQVRVAPAISRGRE